VLNNAAYPIPLYEGCAPGSEHWTYDEKQMSLPAPMAYNVSRPTLTPWLPEPGTATGTAIILSPGGGFYLLAMGDACDDIAQWLQQKGIAVFVLKYRTGELKTDDPLNELRAKRITPEFAENITNIIPLAIADGLRAVAYLRTHAAEYGIDPNRIGTLGFSAGGTVALASAVKYDNHNRPDFAAALYSFLPPEYDAPVPADAPPLFLAAAIDDKFGLAVKTTEQFMKWINAGRKAELHVYENGGHGFGMAPRSTLSDDWKDRFYAWLTAHGLTRKISAAVS
jgi:acetyl esterase/lipase